MANNNKLSIYYRYWIYSKNEADRMNKVGNSMSGKRPALGRVFTEGGVMKYYTSIVSNLSQVTEADAVVVMQGDIRQVNYRDPEFY